jgi:ABC-type polysaccharide/polyol phosphate transport system ATPase subunit
MRSEELAISVQGLSKAYIIAHEAEKQSTLAETMLHKARNPLKRRTKERFMALNNVSFDIMKGEVVGIMGRNGAGKSTLLKILSRVTEPTAGKIDLYGRVGSLLEVGTGFHPELTGRENVYLNGAILGMPKTVIRKQFDAIVEFAGIDKFLDTPVKRYSSGMDVRLAFAVAAHLNPEILIIDEVLAVGDYEFQQKCLGKMKEVSKTGRTVLFVSHNTQALSQLTESCIILRGGSVDYIGPTEKAIPRYLAANIHQQRGLYEDPSGEAGNRVRNARVRTSDDGAIHRWGESLAFEFDIQVSEPSESLCFSFQIFNGLEQAICHFWVYGTDLPIGKTGGLKRLRCSIPRSRLYMGEYSLTTYLADRRTNTMQENLNRICPFSVSMHNYARHEYEWQPQECTYIEESNWKMVGAES